MRDSFDTQPNLVQSSRHSSGKFAPPAMATMQPGTVFTVGNGDAGFWNHSSDSSIRHHLQRESDRKARIEENNLSMDPELTELQTRSQLQEEEIMMLREQIVDACEQELQLLKEKHVLERRLFDLRMALDEKREDAIEDVLKDLSHRKVCIQKT